jgi:hypothetical protein
MEPQAYDQGPPALGPPQTPTPAPAPSPKPTPTKGKRATRASKRKALEPLEELRENERNSSVSDVPPVLSLEGEMPSISLEPPPPQQQLPGTSASFNDTSSFGLGNADNSFFPGDEGGNVNSLSNNLGDLSALAGLPTGPSSVNVNMSLMENMGYDGSADPHLQQQAHAIEGKMIHTHFLLLQYFHEYFSTNS